MSRYAAISQDNGLADWASKIKDMQRQVDADEEAEHRKLEEEIHASRLARRSRGLYGGHTSAEFSMTDLINSVIADDISSNLERKSSNFYRRQVGFRASTRPPKRSVGCIPETCRRIFRSISSRANLPCCFHGWASHWSETEQACATTRCP